MELIILQPQIFEEFSIRPVYTGMSLWKSAYPAVAVDPPRTHGDEPYTPEEKATYPKSAPYTRG